MLIQPVVLSGGSGTRLWPLSREKYPKQLLALVGGEDTLLQATVRRVDGLADVQLCPPMVVCNEEYRFVIAEQLRLMGKEGVIVLEPFGRNTAPALTLAALAAVRDGADPILLVMPADHVITDTPAFQAAVGRGALLADAGKTSFLVDPDNAIIRTQHQLDAVQFGNLDDAVAAAQAWIVDQTALTWERQ